MKIIPEARLTH